MDIKPIYKKTFNKIKKISRIKVKQSYICQRYIDNPTSLKAEFKLNLRDGWRPDPKKNKKVPIKVILAIQQGVETKKKLKDVLKA